MHGQRNITIFIIYQSPNFLPLKDATSITTQPIITKEFLRILQHTFPSGFKKQGGLMGQMWRE